MCVWCVCVLWRLYVCDVSQVCVCGSVCGWVLSGVVSWCVWLVVLVCVCCVSVGVFAIVRSLCSVVVCVAVA